MPISSSLKRVLASWLVAALFVTQTVTFEPSFSKPVVEEYGIVAILVESTIYDSNSNYDGLTDTYGSYLRDDTLWERIDRYAYDIQSEIPMTKALIIEVDPDESVEEVSYVLESLYFDGDDVTDESNHLAGIVVVGDVPLPVVTKGGNKFLSMLPYTDFEDKVYIFNEESGNFERNEGAGELAPEVWHGVIVPPSDSEDRFEELATYFDKNHLYHLGVTSYSDFDEKIFYGDMVAEEKALNDISFGAYDLFTDHWETIAYHRYNKHLIKEIYGETDDVLSGDGVDNDGDGLIDEDPEDGVDNDGDGFIDEDLGDIFDGIDNDGDGLIDEDGTDDNDNDGDGKMNEDPPGDMNGDGCPGVCNRDDDGDASDADDDGWPNGLEMMMNWDFTKKSSPFLFKLTNDDIKEQFAQMFYDEDPFLCPEGVPCWGGISKNDKEGGSTGNVSYDSRCFDAYGAFHPEWDDDEDGYCDEDGDHDNDADHDGTDDEDRAGSEIMDQDVFDLIPDIQTKNMFEQFTKRYYQLFDKLIAQINEWTDYTGRYSSSYLDPNGYTVTDVDSPMSLVGQKDEYTIDYLRSVNDLVEAQVDDAVDEIQQDVLLVASVKLEIRVNFEPDDDDPDNDGDGEPDPHSFESVPIYFINNSASSRNRPFDIVILGEHAAQIDSVDECSAYMGTYDEDEGGSQLVEGLRINDFNTSGEYEEMGKDYGGCFGNYADMSMYGEFVNSLDFCFPEIASEPVRSLIGTEEIDPGDGDESMTPDYRACNDFREITGFFGDQAGHFPSLSDLLGGGDKGYFYYATELTEELDDLFNTEHDEDDDVTGDGVYDEADLAVEIEDYVVNTLNADGAYDEPYKSMYDMELYDTADVQDFLDLVLDDPPTISESMTLAWVFDSLGYEPDNQDYLTDFLTGEDDEFTSFVYDGVIQTIDVITEKYYVDPNNFDLATLSLNTAFTTDPEDGHAFSSVYKHDQPNNETIGAQVEAQFSEALPIDDPRYVSFQDETYEYQELYYPNIFDAEDVDAFLLMLEDTDFEIASIPGGSSYSTLLEDYFDQNIDPDELQDAIDWMNMNIDQKHEYVMTNYLGEGDAYVSDPESGYEIAYLVGDGDQSGYNFSFNGNAKVSDEDFEFNNIDIYYDPGNIGGEEEIPEDDSGDDSGDDSWYPPFSMDASLNIDFEFDMSGLFEWIEEMVEWVDSLAALGSSVPMEFACGDFCIYDDTDMDGIPNDEDPAPTSADEDEDGVPDGANQSVYMVAEVDSEKLYANGADSVEVTVNLMDAYAELNVSDSFTNIQLSIVEGDDYGRVSSANPVLAYQGQATFTVSSTDDAGMIVLLAESANNPDVADSNYIYIESLERHVKLYTYDIETFTDENVYTTTELEDIVLLSADGDLLATIDAASGEIEYASEDIEIEVLPASADIPTRIAFNDAYTGETQGVLYVVPAEESVEIAYGYRSLSEVKDISHVEVMDSNEDDNYFVQYMQGSEEEVLIWEGSSRVVGSIKSNGQIFVREDLGISLELTSDNFASEFSVKVGSDKLAEVKIGVSFDEASIEVIETEEDYLSFWDKVKGWLQPGKVLAEVSLPDSDGDGINDLHEYTIGTDLGLVDTDGDSFSDYEELQAGFDPLSAAGASLFTDLNTDHEAYYDVLALYLRGVLSGYEDGSFRPDKAITREEFTKLNLGGICLYCDIYSVETQEVVEGGYSVDPFPDTDISDGLYYCVADAKNQGLISGYKGGDYEGYYLPGNNISRAEAAKVILEAAALRDSDFDSADYLGTDKPWYYNYVIKAQSFGLFPEDRFTELDHYSDKRFAEWFFEEIHEDGAFISWLSDEITRAEFAMMIVNLIDVYDCRDDDSDGDGLSDYEELYVYGTDPFDPDTDDGGVTDFVEVVSGLDPLDASDDSEEVVSEPVVVSDDEDGDGLSTPEENKIGTLYWDPDTDDGGVWDGMEVLYGTDPLDPSDDDFLFDEDTGVYAVGDLWERDYIYSSEDFVETIIAESVIYISEIPADGYSSLHLRAEVIGENGLIDSSDNYSIVEFIVTDPYDEYAEVAHKQVTVVEGVAETEIIAKTISGTVEVTAEVSPEDYPVKDTEVEVYPGEPYTLEFVTSSTVMAAGGVNKLNGLLMLYDRYGNMSYYDPYTVTLEIEGDGLLTDVEDEDTEQPGYQITTFEGYISFGVISSEEEGVITLDASYGEVTADLDIQVLEGITLVIDPQDSILTADGEETTDFDVYAQDADGRSLEGFNPLITLSVADDTYGYISSPMEVTLEGGAGTGTFTDSTVAGDAYIVASAVGIDPGSALVTTEPGPVHELRFETETGGKLLMTGDDIDIFVKAYDQYGNFAYNDSATEVTVKLTDASQEYATISDEILYTDDGIVSFSVTAGDLSGFANVVGTAENLRSATLDLEIRSDITVTEIEDINPEVLYATLLGAPVGQVTYDGYFAGEFLFNGKTQAVASLLDDPEPHKRMMQLDATGKSTLIEGNFLIHNLVSGSDELPTRVIWQDDPANMTLAETVIILDDSNGVSESEDLITETDPGAYMMLETMDDTYEIKQRFSKINTSISLLEGGNETLRLAANGQITLLDASYILEINENYEGLAVDIYNGSNLVATILLLSGADDDVEVLDDDFEWGDWGTLSPGVYMKQYKSLEYGFEISFSGNSSADSTGYFLVDNEQTLPSSQAPSLGHSSLDSAQDQGGMGFEGDNKNILLFSAGSTAGESNLHAVSEIGVLLGDPTISLAERNDVESTGYTKDIGRIILNGEEPIQDIVPLDYNDDGLQDLLVAYETGVIKLLQNYDAEPRFKDRGDLLDIVNGILSYDHADFDLDGYEDLVIATEDGCIEGEVCVYLYKNNEGQFERINLDIDVGSQVYQIKAADMNNDNYTDIVTSDNVGTIKVFYNQNGEMETSGYYIGNLGVKVDADDDLGEEIYVYYDEMDIVDDDTTIEDDANFYSLPILVETSFEDVSDNYEGVDIGISFDDLLSSSVGNLDISSGDLMTNEEFDFVESSYNEDLIITKYGVDLNGDIIEPDDEIQYEVYVKNVSGDKIDELYISDIAPSLLNVDLDSFYCLTECEGELEISETSVSSRPFLIHGISLGDEDYVKIVYSAYVVSVPKVNIMIGNDLDDYHDDDYLDILATPEGNPTGQVVYFYSNGSYYETGHNNVLSLFGGTRIINYTQDTSDPVDTAEQSNSIIAEIFDAAGLPAIDFNKDEDEDGIPDDIAIKHDSEEPPPFIEDVQDKVTKQDMDNDGLPDSWDRTPNSGDGSDVALNPIDAVEDVGETVGDIVGKVVQALSSVICGGGCIATPLNIAFLVPGMINVNGMPVGFDPGTPIFGVVPPICFGQACYISQIFRFYFSITTTLGMAMGFCVLSYPSNFCWAFNLPILQATGVCDKINGAISSAMSGLTAAIQVGTSTIANAIPFNDTGGGGGTGGLENYSLGEFGIPATLSMNIQVPGFPSVFTEWWKKQKQQILHLIDLPDIYFLYPDPTTLVGEFSMDAFDNIQTSDLNSLSKFLTVLNSLPLLKIETEKVVFNIPTLTQEEILKYKEQAEIWVMEAKNEVYRVAENWIKNGFSAELTLAQDLITTMETNIQTLDEYMELPKKIVEFRNIQVVIIQQIVCYLDAIINFAGGYIMVNKQRIEDWKQFVKDIINAFETWTLLFELAVSYQDSCDKCTNSRGSLLELLMKLFLFIPEPPVIELPRWPDIIIDVSQIQAGLELQWPEVDFRADPLILPDLPTLTLPDLPTIGVDLSLSLPGIPLLPSLPDLPDIPELPPLPLIDLPDVPPAPEVPSLDMSIQVVLKILNVLFKLICFVTQGLVPTQEIQLKAKVEDLTQRPLSVLFPIDFGLSFNAPSISFDIFKEVQVIAKMNLTLETTFIVDAVQFAADMANSMTSLVTDTFNSASQFAEDAMQEGLDAGTDVVDDVMPDDIDLSFADPSYDGSDSYDAAYPLSDDQIEGYAGLLAQTLENISAEMETYNASLPEEIEIIAEQDYIAVEDLPNYDTIAYSNYAEFNNLIQDTPTESLIQLKEQLVAYIDGNTSINTQISDDGWDEFQRLLVHEGPEDYLLADYTEDEGWTNAYEVSDVLNSDEWQPLTNEDLTSIEGSMTDAVSGLLADASENDAGGSDSYETPVPVNKGLFIFDPETETSDRLIEYTAEADQESNIVSFDMDNDGDEDIVYSYGGTVYLKENYDEEPANLAYYAGVPRLADIDHFLPPMTSVNLFKASDLGNEEASMSFSGDVNSSLGYDSVGYTINYYDNLADLELEYPPIGLASVIYKPENEDVSFFGEQEYFFGDEIVAEDDGVAIASTADDLILIPEGAEFTLSDIKKGFAYASLVSSSALLYDSYARTVVYKDGSTILEGGDVIHTLEDSEFTIDFGFDEPVTFVLKQNTILPIDTGFTFDLDIRVERGGIEIIDKAPSSRQDVQTFVEGMLIYEGDKIDIENGYAEITLAKGGYVEVDEDQSYFFAELKNFANPTLDIVIDNGTYYANIWAIDADGTMSTSSNTVLLAPQICADDSPPYPDAGPSKKELPIFNVLTLDASNSFDSESEIVSFYWDLDIETDSDLDGDPENDADSYHDLDPTDDHDGDGSALNDWDDPVLEVGPYDEVGEQFVKLWVTDEAGNSAAQLITIDVYVPDIIIDYASALNGVVTGHIEPAIDDMPFIILRDRDSVVTQLVTDTANEDGKFFTDENGEYNITDVDIESRIVILNAQGEEIAEFNPETGQVRILDERYAADILPTDLEWPTRLIVYEIVSGEIIQSILLVTDSNTDVSIEDEIEIGAGVHMSVIENLGFTFDTIGASDPLFPGSVEAMKDGERHALIASDGNIYLLDEELDLELQEADSLDDPLIIELVYADEIMAEIFIGANYEVYESTTGELGLPPMSDSDIEDDIVAQDSDGDGMNDDAELIYGLNPLDPDDASADNDEDGLTNLEEIEYGTDPNNSDSDYDGLSDYEEIMGGLDPLVPVEEPFTDIPIDDPLFVEMYDMVIKGILSGYEIDGMTYFLPEQEINRAEFTKIMLAILCIIPRDSAYEKPDVFNDITDTDLWYYDETKESYLRGFITGYLAETDEDGMTPFKPDATITRAEAAKIIIEALNSEGFIDLGEVDPGEPWWDPYMVIAQDISPYLLGDSAGEERFILTAEEAADPLHEITRYEFVEMSVRALQAYNCYLVDSDGDGLYDWDEENIYGTDPQDADTDTGGIWDGEEVNSGTDPLDDSDDDWDKDTLSNNDETDIYGTDPWDPDTDDGGVWDGVEVDRGSDPLDASDDYPDVYDAGSLLIELPEGVYFVSDECLICPCPSTIENGEQLMSGDIIYSAITNADSTEFYSVSNMYPIE